MLTLFVILSVHFFSNGLNFDPACFLLSSSCPQNIASKETERKQGLSSHLPGLWGLNNTHISTFKIEHPQHIDTALYSQTVNEDLSFFLLTMWFSKCLVPKYFKVLCPQNMKLESTNLNQWLKLENNTLFRGHFYGMKTRKKASMSWGALLIRLKVLRTQCYPWILQ